MFRLFRYHNKSYRIILPTSFRDLYEVFAEVPEDSRVLSERRVWIPTSDHLQTWLILSRTTRSRQYHASTMVWPNLPPCHRFLYFVLLFSTKTAWQRGSKNYQRFYEDNLRETMVDSWYCLDQVGAEGRSQISRQSEVGKHKRCSVFRWALLSNEYFMHFLALRL